MKDAILENRKSYCEVVAFRVSDQDFCFDLTSVREIRGWTETTMLPHAQPYVKGVINLRGSVVPVVDLSERLGLGATEPGPRNVIIITVLGQRTVGLLADVVSDILTVSETDIQPIPDIIDDGVRRFISGVLLVEGRMIRKMDLEMIIPTDGRSAG
ncbi:MAG: chemotaxis protein CheW [Roseovarius sp.]